jgi:hypothetical protein
LAVKGTYIPAAAAASLTAGIGRLRFTWQAEQTQPQQAQSRNDHFPCINEKSSPVHDLPIFFIVPRHESTLLHIIYTECKILDNYGNFFITFDNLKTIPAMVCQQFRLLMNNFHPVMFEHPQLPFHSIKRNPGA